MNLVRGSLYWDMEMEYARRTAPTGPRAASPIPDWSETFAVRNKSWFVAELAKKPRDFMTPPDFPEEDPWVQQCPPGRVSVSGLAPDRACRLYRLERTGPGHRLGRKGEEIYPGRLWFLRTAKGDLILRGYSIEFASVGVVDVGEDGADKACVVFGQIINPIDISIPARDWDRMMSAASGAPSLEDAAFYRARKLVCPGSGLRRDARDQAFFKKYFRFPSMEEAGVDSEWLESIEDDAG